MIDNNYEEYFEYFSIYPDIEIDFSKLLENNSNFFYKETLNSNFQETKVNLKNIFLKYSIIETLKLNTIAFTQYEIKDFETPFLVSYNLYGKTDYWWLLCLFNNIKDLAFDWVLTDNQIKIIASDLFEKEKIYPFNVYISLLEEQNDKKRNILVPQKKYINQIVWDLKNLLEIK